MAALLLAPVGLVAQTAPDSTKTLVVFYSRSGNTEAVANFICELTGADSFRIETVKPYPADYNEMTEVAKAEKNRHARPAIRGKVADMVGYDTIYVGFPTWWGDCPMAVETFLESYDLAGKTVIPFNTNGGGGVDQGFKTVEKLTPRSNHKEGLSLSGSRARSSRSDVERWLAKIGK